MNREHPLKIIDPIVGVTLALIFGSLSLRLGQTASFTLLFQGALLLAPLYCVPLLAGSFSRGTDLWLFTRPVSDKMLVGTLFLQAWFNLLKVLIFPLVLMGLSLLLTGESILAYLSSLAGLVLGTFLLTGGALLASSLVKKSAPAWLLSYTFLLTLNLIPSLLTGWTSPFFQGYIPLSSSLTLLFTGVFFLILTWGRVLFYRGARVRVVIPTGIVSLALLIMTSLLPGGLDFSGVGRYGVSGQTVSRIKKMEDPLFIRWYYTENLKAAYPEAAGVDFFFDSLRFRAGGHLVFDKISLKDDKAYEQARINNWSEQTVESNKGYEPLFSTLEIEYRGRYETLPFVSDPLILEEQFLSALQRLDEDEKTLFAVINGRGERSLDDFWSILSGALAEYFQVQEFGGTLEELETEQPRGIFVLGGRDLNEWQVSRLFSYLEGGGNVLMALSSLELNPGISDMVPDPKSYPLLDELARRGIHLGDSLIIDPPSSLYLSSGDEGQPDFYPLWFSAGKGGVFDFNAFWSVPIYTDEKPLWKVESSRNSHIVSGLTDLSPASLERQPAGVNNPYAVALAIKEGEGTLVLLSGEESLSDLMVLGDRNLSNAAWIQTMAFYLSENEELFALRKALEGGSYE